MVSMVVGRKYFGSNVTPMFSQEQILTRVKLAEYKTVFFRITFRKENLFELRRGGGGGERFNKEKIVTFQITFNRLNHAMWNTWFPQAQKNLVVIFEWFPSRSAAPYYLTNRPKVAFDVCDYTNLLGSTIYIFFSLVISHLISLSLSCFSSLSFIRIRLLPKRVRYRDKPTQQT